MSSQNPPGGLAYPHYALIYIDSDGNLRHEASRSVANSREAILSPRVTNEFLRAVVRSGGAVASHSRCKSHTEWNPYGESDPTQLSRAHRHHRIKEQPCNLLSRHKQGVCLTLQTHKESKGT